MRILISRKIELKCCFRINLSDFSLNMSGSSKVIFTFCLSLIILLDALKIENVVNPTNISHNNYCKNVFKTVLSFFYRNEISKKPSDWKISWLGSTKHCDIFNGDNQFISIRISSLRIMFSKTKSTIESELFNRNIAFSLLQSKRYYFLCDIFLWYSIYYIGHEKVVLVIWNWNSKK